MSEGYRLTAEQLFEHEENLRSLVISLLLDESRVDDVLQETWMTALTRPPSSLQALRSWLNQVAKHFAYRVLREEGRRETRERLASRPEVISGAAMDAEREEAGRTVVRQVLGLREPYRTVVVLRFFEDLAPPEIAARIHEPIETVKTRLKRALHMLRGRLDKVYGRDNRSWTLALLPVVESLTDRTVGPVAVGKVIAASLALVVILIVAMVFGPWALAPDRDPGSRLSDTRNGVAGHGMGSRVLAPHLDEGRKNKGEEKGSPAIAPPRAVRSPSHSVNLWNNRLSFLATWEGEATGFGVLLTPEPWVAEVPQNHGASRWFQTTLPGAPGSRFYLHVAAFGQVGAASSIVTRGPFLVDSVPPPVPSRITLLSHKPDRWSAVPTVKVTWDRILESREAHGSPLRRYGVSVVRAPDAADDREPAWTEDPAFFTNLGTSLHPYFVRIWAEDCAGNRSRSAVVGPIRIDTVAPVHPRVAVESQGPWCARNRVTLIDLGADDAHSGVARMRFSLDGQIWSPWEPFASRRPGWELCPKGETTPGLRRVFAQYEDAAGNRSTPASTEVHFAPLQATDIAPRLGPLIGEERVTITGQGFQPGRTQVTFGRTRARAVSVHAPGRLTCITPAHLAWESVDVVVSVPGARVVLADGYLYAGGDVVARGDPETGGRFTVILRAPADGGRHYQAAASLGSGPIQLDPHGPLELSVDSVFVATSQGRASHVFEGLAGELDERGRAEAVVRFPPASCLVGITFFVGFVTLEEAKPHGLRTVSETRPFTIRGCW